MMGRTRKGAKQMPKIQFWYDFASTYSYLSAMRIECMAAEAGVDIEWRPFLLGPTFAARGWNTSPFNIYPAKGWHMIRDIERICADRGLQPFRLPDPFPQNSLKAARLALIGADAGWAPAFSRAVFGLQFGEGASLTDAVLAQALTAAGQDAEARMSQAQGADIKARLKTQNDNAQALGIFGAPTFIIPSGELFWGDDRLEQALAWTLAWNLR